MAVQSANLNQGRQFLDELTSWQALWIGGFSILFFLATWAFVDKSGSLYTVSLFVAALAFAANHPHFLSSYILLYSDSRNFLKKPRYIWAGVLVPLVLLSLIIYGMLLRSIEVMSLLVNLMFFTVGWHYVKQVFGCVIVSSVQQKKFYNPLERRALIANLYSVWALSWCSSQVGNHTFDFYGMHYMSFNIPAEFIPLSYSGIGISLAGLIWLHVQKYIQEGFVPSAIAVVAFVNLYVWYIPVIQHPTFGYAIPLFHSLQYLCLVTLLKKNETLEKCAGQNERESRLKWLRHFWGFLVAAIVLGALAFEFIPKTLDVYFGQNFNSVTPQIFLVAFLLFINIHHYFIDNVIWRSDNENVKKNLFHA